MRQIKSIVNLVAVGLLLGATNSFSETITYRDTTYNLAEVTGSISSKSSILASQPWWLCFSCAEAASSNAYLEAAARLDKFIGKRFAFGTTTSGFHRSQIYGGGGGTSYSIDSIADDGVYTWYITDGIYVPGPSSSDTQSSLTRLASGLRGTFNSASLISNFPNSNTYDCNLFDVKGMCISAGGRYSTVDNPSSNSSAAVVTLGYKVSPNIRIGGFLDQSVNTHSPTGIDISNKHPMMGAFAYWNQNADGLGYQVKIANAYQDKDLSTTRDVIGTSEAGRGNTSLNTRSYVSELSYV
jgi:hypothetical protein